MINNIDDLNNLTDADLRDIFDNIEFDIEKIRDQKSKPKAKTYVCPNCSSKEIIKDITNGIIVCTNSSCGQVIDVILDDIPEWRQYEDDSKNEGRCSMPINQLLPISSIGTNISGNYKSRLKTLQIWGAMPYRERSLNNVFKKIHEICHLGDMMKCIETDANIMYKNISDCKHIKGKGKDKYIIIRGKNRESLIAACVFFACRKNGKTRTPKEIADLFELKYTEITKGCKNFLKLMKIKNIGLTNGTSHPEQFVPRFCNKLQLNRAYTDQVMQITKNIRKLNIASVHTPFSTATCSILLMADINKLKTITKKKLANMFGVSEVTITKTYNKIEKYRKALINDELTDKLVKILADARAVNTVPDSINERFKLFKDIKIEVNPKTTSSYLKKNGDIPEIIQNITDDKSENLDNSEKSKEPNKQNKQNKSNKSNKSDKSDKSDKSNKQNKSNKSNNSNKYSEDFNDFNDFNYSDESNESDDDDIYDELDLELEGFDEEDADNYQENDIYENDSGFSEDDFIYDVSDENTNETVNKINRSPLP